MNLHLQLKQYDVCCSLFVQLCSHELKYCSAEQQNYLWLFKKVQGLEATAALLQGLTAAQVKKIVLAPLEIEWAMLFKDEQDKSEVELQVCAHCARKESSIKAFKKCQRCCSVYYCGGECQARHWLSGHKEACKPL